MGLAPFLLGSGCESRNERLVRKLDLACAAYCRASGKADCASSSVGESCEGNCRRHGVEALEAACAEERLAYLRCATDVRLSCAGDGCPPAACLEEDQSVRGCGAEFQALETCFEPCRFAGTLRVAERRVDGGLAKLEAVRAGCGDCPSALQRGAAPASPCQSPKVCEQYCCGCEGGRGRGRARFLARACVDGRCATPAVACGVSESELGEELCAR